MLSGYQCEVIAYVTDGDIICRECAAEDYSELTLDKLEQGLTCVATGHLSPLIRYQVDELDRSYEYAEERVREFVGDHPALFSTDTEGWLGRFNQLVDRWAQRHPVPECCGSCGKELD